MNKILIIAPNWIGDVVMSLPTIEKVRDFFQKDEIYIFIKDNIFPLIEENCKILNIKPVFYSKKNLSETLKYIATFRKLKFNHAFILPRSYRMFITALLSNIKYKYGYGDKIKNFFYTKSIKRDTKALNKHRVFYYIDIVKLYNDFETFNKPVIKISTIYNNWADNFFKKNNLEEKFVIGLNPGATYGEAKCWGKDKFRNLCGSLLKKNRDFYFLIFGGKDNSAYNSFFENMENSINLTGKLSLMETASLINKCNIFITNDTGPMHIADALQKNIIAIFGPTDPNETPPFQMNKFIVYKNLDCSPCKKRICPLKHNNCMKEISVKEVEEMVLLNYSSFAH